MSFRIGIAQISSESNHFVPGFSELEFFSTTGYLLEGKDLLRLSSSDTEIGGFLSVLLRDKEVEVVPLIAARANSANPLSDRCYKYLKNQILNRLEHNPSIHGLLISNHGSMCVQSKYDPEGDLAQSIRKVIGAEAPLAITLDLHGNVTQDMVQASNLIIGYRTYPHCDAFKTGQKAAKLLMQAVRGQIKPVVALAQLPLLLTSFHASTEGNGPFAKLRKEADQIEQTHLKVLSASVFNVGSYIDVPEMGCSAVVITNNDKVAAKRCVKKLATQHWNDRESYEVKILEVENAVRLGQEIEGGPILFLDTADTTGGGAAGDGITLVKRLLELKIMELTLATVVDPETVHLCREHAIGSKIQIEVGHRIDSRWGQPLKTKATIMNRSDGRIRYQGGIFGGTEVSMGPSVVLKIESIQLLVTTYPTYEWAHEQYDSMGMYVEQAKFVCVKNMMNFRQGYADIMKAFFVVNLPGPTPTNMRLLPFRRITRPVYPIDEMPDVITPKVTTNL